MLTKALRRFSVSGGAVVPRFLGATPASLDLAQQLLDHWREHVGHSIGEADDAALPILHASRTLPVAKGLHKLLHDHSTFRNPPERSALRAAAFTACAQALRQPHSELAAHRSAVAALLNTSSTTLHAEVYDDHPDRAVIAEVPNWSADQLLRRYNTALAQALLLDAQAMTIHLHAASLARLRGVLRAIRFGRLVAVVRVDGDGYRIELDGPAAVLDQAAGYGLRFAQVLPAVAAEGAWSLHATLRDDHGSAQLSLDARSPLAGWAGTTHIPDELLDLGKKLGAKHAGWSVDAGQPLTLTDGEVVAPDCALVSASGQRIEIELLHRHHLSVARRRCDQVARGWAPNLRIGLDRNLLKLSDGAGLDQHPAVISHGFLFSGMPTAQTLAALIARL